MNKFHIIICVLCIITAFSACKSKHKMYDASNHNNTTAESVSLSNGFRTFLDDMQSDSTSQAKANLPFPSNALIKKYMLTMSNNQYFVKGFLETDSNFDTAEPVSYGIETTFYGNNIYSFRSPIHQATRLKKINGIKRIDINNKVKTRKQPTTKSE